MHIATNNDKWHKWSLFFTVTHAHFLHPIIMLKMCSTTSISRSVYAYTLPHQVSYYTHGFYSMCACLHCNNAGVLSYITQNITAASFSLVTYATLGLIQHTYNRCRMTYHLLSHYHLHQSCICILWPYFIQVLKSSASALYFALAVDAHACTLQNWKKKHVWHFPVSMTCWLGVSSCSAMAIMNTQTFWPAIRVRSPTDTYKQANEQKFLHPTP